MSSIPNPCFMESMTEVAFAIEQKKGTKKHGAHRTNMSQDEETKQSGQGRQMRQGQGDTQSLKCISFQNLEWSPGNQSLKPSSAVSQYLQKLIAKLFSQICSWTQKGQQSSTVTHSCTIPRVRPHCTIVLHFRILYPT